MSVSNSFTAAGAGTSIFAYKGDQLSYSVSGTFVGTVIIERSDNNAASWVEVNRFTAAASGGMEVDFGGSNSGLYRFNCVAFTSGTIVCSISDVDTIVASWKNSKGETLLEINEQGVSTYKNNDGVGAVNGATVTVQELGNGVMNKTVLTLVNTPVSIVSVTTGAGVGGTKIYDFPAGYIQIHGGTANLTLGAETEADFTDGTPEGDIGVGTVAPANADAFGTDATDDNILTGAAIAMTDYADSVTLAPEASLNIDGTSTAVDLYVNALIDAADIDDDTTTNLLVSGTITILWSNLGDY